MADPLQDIIAFQAGLNRMNPLDTYSQGLLSIALADRQNAARRAETAQQQAFELQRDKAQQAFQLERDKAQSVLYGEQMKEQRSFDLSKQEQGHKFVLNEIEAQNDAIEKRQSKQDLEKRRLEMITKANRYGANLPDNASLQDASKAFTTFAGDSFVSAMKNAGEAFRALNAQDQSIQVNLVKSIADRVASDPLVVKELKPEQLARIRTNPASLPDLISSLTGNKKAYTALTEASQRASDIEMAILDKRLASKPELEKVRFQLQMAQRDLDEVRKDMEGIPAQAREDARKAYQEAAFGPASTQPAPTGRFQGGGLPPLPTRTAPGVAPPSPGVAPAVPTTAVPAPMVAPTNAPGTTLFGQRSPVSAVIDYLQRPSGLDWRTAAAFAPRPAVAAPVSPAAPMTITGQFPPPTPPSPATNLPAQTANRLMAFLQQQGGPYPNAYPAFTFTNQPPALPAY